MAERQIKQRGEPVWKDKIRQEIDTIMRDTSTTSYNDFRERLEGKRYKKYMKEENVTYELLEGNKKVRGAKLGTDYEKEGIKDELDRREKHRNSTKTKNVTKNSKNGLLTDSQKIELIAKTVDQLATRKPTC